MDNNTPVIVIAAFGTSMPCGQKNLEDFDKMVLERFPNADVRWALTSKMVAKKLKNSGQHTIFARKVPIKNLDEVYADLVKEGKKNAVVQSLHNMVGTEFRKVLSSPSKGLNVKYGYPLLFDPSNIKNVADVLSGDFGSDNSATILCGHGNETHPEFNAALIELDKHLADNYKNTYVCTVEGPPETEAFAKIKANKKITSVRFIPLMIVAGDHIENDVMGDDENSWKSQLGLPATAQTGMGNNPKVMEFFLQSIGSALRQF